MGYRVAVVGATGNVGREILNILAERQFPLDEVAAVASARSTGDVIDFGDSGEELKVKNLEHFDFAGWDIALFAAGSEVSKVYAPKAAAAGCTVIDNSSLFRMDPDVPLIVPEVNADAIAGYRQEEHHRQPELLDRAAGGGAEAAARRGEDQARRGRDLPVGFGRRQSGDGRAVRAVAQHLRRRFQRARRLSQADRLQRHPAGRRSSSTTARPRRNGRWWSRPRRSSIPTIKVTATCVRVPVFVGHSEAVNIEFENEISADEARDILREAPGVMVVDKREDGGYVTPVECVGEYATYVSRIREDPTVENGLSLWVVSDNLRKGAALNAVQIAELLGRKHLQKARLRACRPSGAAGWSWMSCSRLKFSGSIFSPSSAATSLSSYSMLRRNGSWTRLWMKVIATSRSPLVTGIDLRGACPTDRRSPRPAGA